MPRSEATRAHEKGHQHHQPGPEPSAGGTTPADGVGIRRLPYPFRDAFSIANDIDGTTWRDFLGIYRLLCGRKDGLGLALSSSFFLLPHKNPDENFSFFKDLNCAPGPRPSR